MPIKCQICEREFSKQITGTHLKTHNTTTIEYKMKYGHDSLSSPEYRLERSAATSGKNNPNYQNKWTPEQKQHLSNEKKGSVPWNKGTKVTDPDHLASIRAGTESRENKYKSGELVRSSNECSEATKSKISNSVTEYAKLHPREMKERSEKAIQTKIGNGYDLAFFCGKTHSPETKKKISDKSKIHNKVKSEKSKSIKEEMAKLGNLTIVSYDDRFCNISCNVCHTEFTFTSQYFTDSKFFKEMCPTCHPREVKRSKAEAEIYEYVRELSNDAIHSNRTIISPKEVDILVPSKKIAIEYNGCYWHCEEANKAVNRIPKSDNEKLRLVEEAGYRLITIYDDEYINTPEIVKSRLAAILGKTSHKIFARKTTVREVSSKIANAFLREHHIQSSGRSNIRIGLYSGDELVSVMTFSNSNISRKIVGWELNRFCHKTGYTVVGGASRMFKYFIRNHNPDNVISYADRRWSQGEVYSALGFEFTHNSPPNYWYILPNTPKRIHRYSLRKNKDDDPSLTEYENRLLQGYNRIWDCGSSKWTWTPKI